MQRNSGRVLPLHWDQSTSKTALYIQLWSMMKSQKLEDKHFFFFFLSSMTVGYIVPMIPFFLPTTPSLMSTNFFTLLFREILYILIGEPNTCYWKGN